MIDTPEKLHAGMRKVFAALLRNNNDPRDALCVLGATVSRILGAIPDPERRRKEADRFCQNVHDGLMDDPLGSKRH